MKALFIILFTFLFITESDAAEPNNCFFEKYKKYTEAQKKWQRDSTSLVRRHKPVLSEIANIYMQDQLVRIEKNLLAVELLSYSNSEKLKIKRKMNRWLDLSKEDEQALAKKNKRYAELLLLKNAAKQRKPHPDGDKLRTAMRTEIMLLPEFQELLSRFNDKVKEIESKPCDNVT